MLAMAETSVRVRERQHRDCQRDAGKAGSTLADLEHGAELENRQNLAAVREIHTTSDRISIHSAPPFAYQRLCARLSWRRAGCISLLEPIPEREPDLLTLVEVISNPVLLQRMRAASLPDPVRHQWRAFD